MAKKIKYVVTGATKLDGKRMGKKKPKKKKKRINSRTKGNTFERKVGGLVVKAFEQFGITKEDCYRTPSSGGHRYAKKEDPSDLVISKRLRKRFPFHVEAKHHRTVQLWPLWFPMKVHKNAWKFKLWLKQVTTESRDTGLVPLLVFKGNGNMPIMCAFPRPAQTAWMPHLSFHFVYEGEMWSVVRFSQFLLRLVKYGNHFSRT